MGRRDWDEPRHAQYRLVAAAPGRGRLDPPSGSGCPGREEPRMILLDPIWLLLAVPLGASLWLWRLPSRWVLAVRCLVLLLLLLGLAGLAVYLPGRAGIVVVVADRSLSMPPDSETAQKEAID